MKEVPRAQSSLVSLFPRLESRRSQTGYVVDLRELLLWTVAMVMDRQEALVENTMESSPWTFACVHGLLAHHRL